MSSFSTTVLIQINIKKFYSLFFEIFSQIKIDFKTDVLASWTCLRQEVEEIKVNLAGRFVFFVR